MPSLGADMESGTFVAWHVKPGDHVGRGDLACVVETQKGAVDVEIWDSGTVAELVAKPGEVVPVGGLLARVAEDQPAAAAPVATRPGGGGTVPAEGSPASVHARPSRPEHQRVSPSARRRALELGLSLAAIEPTGPDGAITLADVERAALGAERTVPEAGPGGMRTAIAAAMARSKREIPHYYLSHEIRVDAALTWLALHNEGRAPADRVLLAALMLKAVALALREVRVLNGHFVDGVFRPGTGIHLGVAIALKPDGLVAPAIPDTDTLGLDVLMARLKDLIARARRGALRASELAMPTATVTSLGDLGVDAVHGVIHPPQVALVGLGTVAARPWVEAGAVVAARTVHATLAADHRVSDGMRGAAFLSALDCRLRKPETLA
ncbi:MAG: dihydrolipoamide acetyltransferase family protein [Betaproteobacteria bacterium]